MQRRRKAPGAAALAPDQYDGLGARRRDVAADARPPAASRQPYDGARRAHHRNRERHQSEQQAEQRGTLSGMQHVDCFGRTLPAAQVGPAQRRSGALVKVARAEIGLEREDVGRIAGIGEAEFAQAGDRG